jgi:hypothetical protein
MRSAVYPWELEYLLYLSSVRPAVKGIMTRYLIEACAN